MPITPEDVPPHLLYEWHPLTRQDIADVLNDQEHMPDADGPEGVENDTSQAG